MKSFRQVITFIFVAALARQFQIGEETIAVNPMLRPFLRNWDLQKIEDYYQRFFVEKMGSGLGSKGSVPKIVKELATMDLEGLSTERVTTVPEEYQEVMVGMMSRREAQILDEQFGDLKADFQKFYKNLARALTKEGVEHMTDRFVTASQIQAAADKFKEVKHLSMLEVENFVNVLDGERQEFIQQELPHYEAFIAFRQDSEAQIDTMLKEVLELLVKDTIPVNSSNLETSLDKIMCLLRTVMEFKEGHENPLVFITEIVQKYVFDLMNFKMKSSKQETLVKQLVQRVFTLYANTHSVKVIELGKVLFLKYFIPASYTTPDAEYIKFVFRRYHRRGLTFEALLQNKAQLDVMQALAMMDLLYASIFMDRELLSVSDVDTFLHNFDLYSRIVSAKELYEFDHIRRILMTYSAKLMDYETLFNELYDTGLYAVSYAASAHTNELLHSSLYFDEFLNTIYANSQSYVSKITGSGIPSTEFYHVNIEENYLFYKLVHLATNYRKLVAQHPDKAIKFAKLTYTRDKQIEKFIFSEIPGDNGFVDFLKNTVFRITGNNISHLINTSLSLGQLGEFLNRLDELEQQAGFQQIDI